LRASLRADSKEIVFVANPDLRLESRGHLVPAIAVGFVPLRVLRDCVAQFLFRIALLFEDRRVLQAGQHSEIRLAAIFYAE
jgi:hypothetical protein